MGSGLEYGRSTLEFGHVRIEADAQTDADADSAIAAIRNVTVSATTKLVAEADAFGQTIGVVGGIGAALADAEAAPTVSAQVAGTAVVAADNILAVKAENAAVADAYALAPGGGIIAGLGAGTDADASAWVDAAVESGATVRPGGLDVRAASTNRAEAESSSLNVSFLGVGVSEADATANGKTLARMDGRVAPRAGKFSPAVNVIATSSDIAEADASAPAGDLLSGVGAEADATGWIPKKSHAAIVSFCSED